MQNNNDQFHILSSLSHDSVDQIVSDLPDFPSERIRSCFTKTGVEIEDTDDIPREFSKYFAVMKALAGGDLAGKRLLDIGTGLGVFVSQARCLGMKTTGVDLFSEYNGTCYQGALCVFQAYGHSAQEAQETFIKQDIVECGDFENKFDFVTSFGMLEHVYPAEARNLIVQRMMRYLVPGGSMLLVCGPNKFFPLDLHHYGPKFLGYHCLPQNLKKFYVRAFAKPGQCIDPTWLNGIKVSELTAGIRGVDPQARIMQGFPLWVRLARTRFLRLCLVNKLVLIFSKIVSFLHMEPVIIMIARKSLQQSNKLNS